MSEKLRILRFKNLQQIQTLRREELIGINFGNNLKVAKMMKSNN